MVQFAKGPGIALSWLEIVALLAGILLLLSIAAASVSQGQENSTECLAYDDHGVCTQWSAASNNTTA